MIEAQEHRNVNHIEEVEALVAKDKVEAIQAELNAIGEKLKAAEKELKLAKAASAAFEQGKEAGIQIMALLNGLEASGMSKEMAWDIYKLSIQSHNVLS